MDSPLGEKKHFRNWADEVDEEDGECSSCAVLSHLLGLHMHAPAASPASTPLQHSLILAKLASDTARQMVHLAYCVQTSGHAVTRCAELALPANQLTPVLLLLPLQTAQ